MLLAIYFPDLYRTLELAKLVPLGVGIPASVFLLNLVVSVTAASIEQVRPRSGTEKVKFDTPEIMAMLLVASVASVPTVYLPLIVRIFAAISIQAAAMVMLVSFLVSAGLQVVFYVWVAK